MRAVLLGLVMSLAAAAAFAQSAPQAGGGAGGITRDQFIQRATTMAGRRFDAIDVDHKGVITRAQIRAFRQAHPGGGRAQQ